MLTNKLNVYYHEKLVGTLVFSKEQRVYFQYDEQWLKNGFPISPFSLPLKNELFTAKKNHFDGLFGVFADSLPDAWGNILLNRILRKNNLNINEINVLDRLAIIGNSGMGALTYQPEMLVTDKITEFDLDTLANECQKILTSEYTDSIDTLYKLGGSSGGARPKILTTINNEDWIIKFPAHVDAQNIGEMEYDYYQCALHCKIPMSNSRLFPSSITSGYFGTKRFDRIHNQKIHMISAAALLEIDFRQPSLDYNDLMKLTKIVTKNNVSDIEQLFRMMCFNVFSHNRDDHAKNFSYLYDETTHRFRLSPAYDLTYSTTYYGEHTTSINGNGANPTKNDLLQVGLKAGMNKNSCMQIIDEIEMIVKQELSKYL